ncbi:hypothetical protein DE146DRAFT_139799 [Phaeosphaeria sp. MPI-PUGE-AT-0046c]|nr:hypothetical protein DE146DRAFT_139799 [Phaeosphaeria sp. MPI-PUGE-AT-0046c]
MNSSSVFYTPQSDQAVTMSGKLPEVAQEAFVNGMMGFGRQARAALLVTEEDDYNRPAKPASIRSQPYSADRSPPSFVAIGDDEPVGFANDPDLFYSIVGGSDRCAMTLSLRSTPHVRMSCTTPEAEDFYRSSSPYKKWVEERAQKRTIETPRPTRPLTPFPRTTSRRYATLHLPSAGEQAYIDTAILLSQHAHPRPFNPRRRCEQQRPEPPPPRLPVAYRASMPFSSAQARSMSPSHWLYNAPRVGGGVQLEVKAPQRVTEGRAAVHRALWPEEREEMLGEVNGMVGRFIRGPGVVRDEEGQKEEGRGSGHSEEKRRKGEKFGWMKRLLGRKKKEKEGYKNRAGVSRIVVRPAGGISGPFYTSVRSSTKQEQRNFSNDTTVVARSTPTIIADSPSPPQRILFEDHADCRGSEESICVFQTRDV